ncbi:hypothetical protein E2562_019149 [Oryza meyeriana var. granulata]|nr:hypothetical protein E2562_019149 [Oryza meyeriana var. granulata]
MLGVMSSCWLKNGAWRPLGGEPYLARTLVSPLLWPDLVVCVYLSHIWPFWFWLVPSLMCSSCTSLSSSFLFH